MNPAHHNRTTFAVAIAVTFAASMVTAVLRGPLEATASVPAAATVDHRAGPSLQSLLTGPLGGPGTAPVRSTEAAPTRIASPCQHNQRRQLVTVSIEQQHAWACSGRRTVISTAVTTGASAHRGSATPRGSFAVQALTPNTTLRPSRGGAYRVRYWIPFRMGEWGFHDAPWQKIPFGSDQFVRHGSHGCVHVPLKAMRELFHWVKPGTAVRIR